MVQDGHGGGVILYVRNDLAIYNRSKLNEYQAEAVWCKIKILGNTETVMVKCYKSQAAGEIEMQDFGTVISEAAKRQVLVMEGLNFPNVNWDTNESHAMSANFCN